MTQAELFPSLHVKRAPPADERLPSDNVAILGRRVSAILRGDELDPVAAGELRGWLAELSNWRLWVAFYRRAEQLRQAGRERYGARALVEVIRFDSALADADSLFKINNNITPLLGRLYNAVSGVAFFETREFARSNGSKKA